MGVIVPADLAPDSAAQSVISPSATEPPPPAKEPPAPAGAKTPAEQETVLSYDLKALLSSDGSKGARVVAKPTLEPFYHARDAAFSGYELGTLLRTNSAYARIDKASHSLRFVCVDGYSTVFPFKSIEGGLGVVATKKGEHGETAWPKINAAKTRRPPVPTIWSDKETPTSTAPGPISLLGSMSCGTRPSLGACPALRLEDRGGIRSFSATAWPVMRSI